MAISVNVLSNLRRPQPWRPVLQWGLAWVWIYLLVQLALWNYWWAPLCALFIVGRAGVFLQLVHESTHHSISRSTFNDTFGQLCAVSIGLDLDEYRRGHLRHHADTNGNDDPPSDSEKYRVCSIHNKKIWPLFFKDICGLTALYVRSQYRQNVLENVRKYVQIIFIQIIILWILFRWNVLAYVLLWPLPLMTLHMVLMRIRGIGEHGLGMQQGLTMPFDGTPYTRSFGTPMRRYKFLPFVWLERALIGSLNVYYHHEHHLYPTVPYYSLPTLHRYLSAKIAATHPKVYTKWYLACLWV